MKKSWAALDISRANAPATLQSLVVSNHSSTSAGNKDNNCNGNADHSDTKNNESEIDSKNVKLVMVIRTTIVIAPLIIVILNIMRKY